MDKKESQSLFDLIFPKEMRIQAGLNDAEASFLYGLWKSAPAGSRQFAIPVTADRKHINALKTKGYLTGFGEAMELTEKGKKVIVEMVTHEPNALEKHAKEVSYTGIKSKSSAMRPKTAFFNKAASKNARTYNRRQKKAETVEQFHKPKQKTNRYCSNCGKTTEHEVKDTGDACSKCNSVKHVRR